MLVQVYHGYCLLEGQVIEMQTLSLKSCYGFD